MTISRQAMISKVIPFKGDNNVKNTITIRGDNKHDEVQRLCAGEKKFELYVWFQVHAIPLKGDNASKRCILRNFAYRKKIHYCQGK